MSSWNLSHILPYLSSFFPFKGNVMKATSILHKAQAMNARPAELLEMAIRNLKAGAKQHVSTSDKEEEQPSGTDSSQVSFIGS